MTKEQTTAIIEAIQTTAEFFMTNGMTIREKLIDPSEDADHVTALLATYSAAIQTIINAIPDD